MKKLLSSALIISALTATSLITPPAMAEGGSVHHSGQASKHVVLAVVDGVETGAKVASAVVAAPIVIAGGVSLAAGSVAVSVGDSIAQSGQRISVHAHSNAPLEVTDLVITADPAPNQVTPPATKVKSKTTTVTTTETLNAVKKTTIEKSKH